MILCRLALRIGCFFIFCALCFHAAAQPALPEIGGAADKGIVILSWNCQYDGVKSITVLRSADSEQNFVPVGMVRKIAKGPQAFVDGHAAPGKNYYKLSLLFKTGLNWKTNRVAVVVTPLATETSRLTLPPNDSLQRYIVTEDITNAGGAGRIATETLVKAGKGRLAPSNMSAVGPSTVGRVYETQARPAPPKQKVSISFDVDERNAGRPADAVAQDPTKRKVTISYEDPMEHPVDLVKSRYINADPLTGHILMTLPDDIYDHHYSVKFYNSANRAVIEDPHITAPKIIIDRRNFQRRGVYRFVLRKDVTELESGYVTIN